RLIEAAEHTANRHEKIDLLLEAAFVHDEKLEQPDRALATWLKVLELDPEHEVAGTHAAARLCDAGHYQEAPPICEMLVRSVPDGDRLGRARREAELGRVCTELGMLQKAVKHFRGAAEADPDLVEASLGLSAALHAVARESGEAERWHEAQAAHRDLLVRHQGGLADGRLVDVWHWMGESLRALGDTGKAEEAFRRAIERDPLHEPSLEALVELATARGDWKTVVAAKRDLMEGASEERRVQLLEEVGDLCREKLADPVAALGAYLEAIQLRPGSHVLLHKSLELYTETKQWRRAIDMLAALAGTENEARRRAKYHYAAAVIARDELGDPDLAVEQFGRSLDDDPTSSRAFEALDQMLRSRGDYQHLARTYR